MAQRRTYRTAYRKAMTRASRAPGVWFTAKAVGDPVYARNYLRRTYPQYDWSWFTSRDEIVMMCRFPQQ